MAGERFTASHSTSQCFFSHSAEQEPTKVKFDLSCSFPRLYIGEEVIQVKRALKRFRN